MVTAAVVAAAAAERRRRRSCGRVGRGRCRAAALAVAAALAAPPRGPPVVSRVRLFVSRISLIGWKKVVAADRAVARAAGGHALRLVAGEPRAAGVAALGADVGAGQAGDRALRVVDRLVLGLDRAAARAGGGAGAADRRADRRLGASRRPAAVAAAKSLTTRLRRPVAVDLDDSPVGVARERPSRANGALRHVVEAGGRGALGAAVPGGDEAARRPRSRSSSGAAVD